MNGFENDEDIHGQQDTKAYVNGLIFQAFLDVNIEAYTAPATCLRRIGHHHGANKEEEPKGDLAASVGEEMSVHGNASAFCCG